MAWRSCVGQSLYHLRAARRRSRLLFAPLIVCCIVVATTTTADVAPSTISASTFEVLSEQPFDHRLTPIHWQCIRLFNRLLFISANFFSAGQLQCGGNSTTVQTDEWWIRLVFFCFQFSLRFVSRQWNNATENDWFTHTHSICAKWERFRQNWLVDNFNNIIII